MNFQIKRYFDIFVSSFLLLFFAPLMVIIAILIKLTSKGPIFYSQKRCGMNCRLINDSGDIDITLFEMYKFRTMVNNAELHTGPCIASASDSRITKIGSILRKTRLDELPQLWNVLKGDMSVVGPRPERPEIIRQVGKDIPFFKERTRFVKPGITGLSQINLNYDGSIKHKKNDVQLSSNDTIAETFKNKFMYDMAYNATLERPVRALILDIKIIFITPIIMFRCIGR